MIHRLTYGAGAQTVRTVALDQRGQPARVASATYAVVDLRYSADDSGHVLASGAATVDSVSTTTASATGRGAADPRAVTVASATGITVGRRYLLQKGGRAVVVQVAGIDGTTIRFASPVEVVMASGAAFLGLELSCSVPSAVCDEEDYLDNPDVLALRWTPDGLLPYLEPLFVERTAPAQHASPEDIFKMDPTLHAYAGDDMTAAGALTQAQDDLNVDLLAAGVEDDQILAGPIGRRALIYCAAYHLIKHSTDPSAVTRAERYHARWRELTTALLQGRDKAKVRRLDEDLAAQGKSVRGRFAAGW